MPTGYTAELMEKGLPFDTFVLRCARAFGACIMQRDEGIETLPAKQHPSDYHSEAIKEAKADLKRLRAMSAKKQHTYGLAEREKEFQEAAKSLARTRAENKRLDDMAEKVRAWEPPTKDHKGLKDFMLEQIKISRNDVAWSEKRLIEIKSKSPESYFVAAVSRAVSDIAHHEEEHKKELERTGGRNEWIEQLQASLGR